MDIASLVRAVTAAYEDASQLVSRIREHRENSQDRALPEEPTRDLLESLTLGPIIIRGHFDHDLKRFGEPYACGDNQAREQMKDVLINLQMTLIITLRSVWMDDMDLDYTILQTTSDDCRVNAGVCLGQLSQRLSEAAKAQSMYSQSMTSYPPGSSLMPPMSPSLAYSSSRSTHASSNYPVPRTPDALTDQFASLGVVSAGRGTYTERKTSISSGGSQISFPKVPTMRWAPQESQGNLPSVGVHRISDQDAESMRRPSSHTLAPEDNLLLSPVQSTPPAEPSPEVLSGNQDINRESYISSGIESQSRSSPVISRTPSDPRDADPRDRFSPDDYSQASMNPDGRDFRYGTMYDVSREKVPAENKTAATSYSYRAQESNHSTLEHIRYLQHNSRPPMHGASRPLQNQKPLPRIDSLAGPRKPVPTYDPPPPPTNGTASTSSSVSLQAFPRPAISAPIPVDHTSQLPPLPRPPRILAGESDRPASRTTTISIPQGPLILPTDKNLQGFCKGAFRLQIGLEKKAFTVANRPAGFSGMVSYWRCEKCSFEGPVYSSVISEGKKKGKPEKLFDPKIRVSAGGGIRYRWAFLAKCHVGLKGMVEGNRDGSFGSFGCIYCCAEGALRGWNGNNITTTTPNLADNASTNGSIRTTSTTGGTPTFGNVASFMEHLEMHRDEINWPNAEMLGRTKCVVGRVAEVYEEWDVNLAPL